MYNLLDKEQFSFSKYCLDCYEAWQNIDCVCVCVCLCVCVHMCTLSHYSHVQLLMTL